MRSTLLLLTLSLAVSGQNVIDRIAVVVGDQVITESEVDREVRLTAFFNQQPLDLSAASRKEAAERLVDQELIRTEMKLGGYREIDPSEGEKLLRQFRQQNYPNTAAFQAVLKKYGLTEDEVTRHLLWQAAALRFTDQRFHMVTPPPPPQQSADRVSAPKSAQSDGAGEEDQMDVWLKQARRSTRIQFKKGAFQ